MNRQTPDGHQTTIQAILDSAREEGSVEGTVERIVFENRDTGFVVARLRPVQGVELVTVVGAGLPVSPGESVRIWGTWVNDQKFGRQLRVERFETVRPATADAIEKYLGSGLIEGIGPHFAKKLVAAFGIDTLRVIDEEPERLRSVGGIGAKRAQQIREAWNAQRAIQSIMLFLQGHGIAASQAARIYKEYGDAAVAVLRDNPYRLADDVSGISFKSADAIANKLGIEKDSPKRVAAALGHVLREASFDGHCFLPQSQLVDDTAQLLGVDAASFDGPLAAMESAKQIVRERDAVFLPKLHAAEVGCSEWIKRIITVPAEPVSIDVERAIAWVEQSKRLTLSDEQREALRTAIRSKVVVITGGPGTGKTTLLNGLLSVFAKKNLGLLLAAPTGRAAKRMSDATGREAKTIHRLLEWSPKQRGFLCHEGNPLGADLVVLDECSMMDVQLMHSMLRALPPQCRLILVGDVDQLPSVGPGNVLMDIIASNVVPVVRLKTIFRQASESGIIRNAHRVNTGLFPEFNDRDCFLIERTDPEKALETIVEVVTARLPKRFNLDPVKDIQVLSPMHRGNAGVARLNEALRSALNPDGARIGQRAIGVRDKVMQTRNNYELDVYNGDIGVIINANDELKEAIIEFEDRQVLYAYEQLDEVTLAYASTVHKAQGSEYPAVVIPMLTEHFMMLQRNVLYTGLTRASRIAVIIGDTKAIGRAVRNVRSTKRNTRLCERLMNAV